MTDYYLMYGGEIDRRRKFTGIANARKAAMKEIRQGMNVNAIVPADNGRYQFLWVNKIRTGVYQVFIEYWSGSKGKFVSAKLNDDGTLFKGKR